MEKIKVCKECNKSEGKVKFTVNKRVCNECRSLKNALYDTKISDTFRTWADRNKVKVSLFLKGTDPCLKCAYSVCDFCGIYHIKRAYVDYDDPRAKEILTNFVVNLKLFIKQRLEKNREIGIE